MSVGIRYKFVENKTGAALLPNEIPPWDGEDRQMKVFVRHLSANDIGDGDGGTRDAVGGGCLIGVVDNVSDILMIEGASYFRIYKAESKAVEYELIDNGTDVQSDDGTSLIHYNLMPNGEIRVLDGSDPADIHIGLAAGDIVVVKVYMGAPYPGTNFKAYDSDI